MLSLLSQKVTGIKRYALWCVYCSTKIFIFLNFFFTNFCKSSQKTSTKNAPHFCRTSISITHILLIPDCSSLSVEPFNDYPKGFTSTYTLLTITSTQSTLTSLRSSLSVVPRHYDYRTLPSSAGVLPTHLVVRSPCRGTQTILLSYFYPLTPSHKSVI